MEPVYELNGLRIVDLTKVLDPKTESRRCHLIRYNTGWQIRSRWRWLPPA